MLDDLDYADDIGLLASKHQDIQQKTQQLVQTANTIGLRVNIGKTKVLRKNIRVGNPITINNQPLQELDDFTYLGSKVAMHGDCTREVITRISKANHTFTMLKPIWRTRNLSIHTKIRIFKTNVLSVLLCDSECWKSTANIEHKARSLPNQVPAAHHEDLLAKHDLK